MILLVEVFFWLVSVSLSIPCLVLFIECLFSLLGIRKNIDLSKGIDFPFKLCILVPAHNEELVIKETLDNLKSELNQNGQLIVIADNCNDRTGEIAKEQEAIVFTRTDADLKGKGYALAFAADQLALDPPDVIIIIDADCRVNRGSIQQLSHWAMALSRPVQADYVLVPSPKASVNEKLSAFAFRVRNRVRPNGLFQIGLPCHLMGAGMAFPWQIFFNAPRLGDFLAEDLLMGVELSQKKLYPQFCPTAFVTSPLSGSKEVRKKQRRRWEHGQLLTLFGYGPGLIWEGIKSLNPILVAIGLDIMVPPLALLVASILLVNLLTIAFALLKISSIYLVVFNLFCLLLLMTGIALGWVKAGKDLVSTNDILMVPQYLFSKIPIYLNFLLGKRQKTWEKTDRS